MYSIFINKRKSSIQHQPGRTKNTGIVAQLIIYGGILIDTSNGWDRFNEMNDWVFDGTRKYSSAYLSKKFG